MLHVPGVEQLLRLLLGFANREQSLLPAKTLHEHVWVLLPEPTRAPLLIKLLHVGLSLTLGEVKVEMRARSRWQLLHVLTARSLVLRLGWHTAALFRCVHQPPL